MTTKTMEFWDGVIISALYFVTGVLISLGIGSIVSIIMILTHHQ